MRIIDLDIDKNEYEESVIALGNFDGIHKGHRRIISNCIDIAKSKGVKSSVLVFKQHTNEVFPHFPRYYISSLKDKLEIFENLGIDIAFIINFTFDFAQLSNEGFMLGFIKNRLNAKTVVCGPDYSFGRKSKGRVKEIQKYKEEGRIDAYIAENFLDGEEKLSSTTIRQLIIDGKVELVKDFLDENYKIRGRVIHGYKIGKELGFPTANIDLEFPYIIPREGVYLTKIHIDEEKYLSLTSIGTNPTVTDDKTIKIETYILDFNKNIYDNEIQIEFLEYMREQIKFDSKEGLIEQMDSDLEYAISKKKLIMI